MPCSPVQHLQFEFSRLPSPDSAVTKAFGCAQIAFDGAGLWWVEAIRIYGRTPEAPTRRLDRSSPDFDLVAVALDTGRREDIDAEINKRLREGGAHMALFGENMPNDATNRMPPPYARPLRRAAAFA